MLDVLYTIIAGLNTNLEIDTTTAKTYSEKETNDSIESNISTICSNILRNYQNVSVNYKNILIDMLIPLHRHNEMTQWRDQIPILQTYHENLVRCMMKLIEKDLELSKETSRLFYLHTTRSTHLNLNKPILLQAIELILSIWPDKYNTNTPKQVLLLHELEILIECIPSINEFKQVKKQLLVSNRR